VFPSLLLFLPSQLLFASPARPVFISWSMCYYVSSTGSIIEYAIPRPADYRVRYLIVWFAPCARTQYTIPRETDNRVLECVFPYAIPRQTGNPVVLSSIFNSICQIPKQYTIPRETDNRVLECVFPYAIPRQTGNPVVLSSIFNSICQIPKQYTISRETNNRVLKYVCPYAIPRETGNRVVFVEPTINYVYIFCSNNNE
jgi:hypothetical protein